MRTPRKLSNISWSELAETVLPIALVSALAIWLAVHFMQPAPPHTLTISAGPKGSAFESAATRYAKVLKGNEITLKILNSRGSLENLQRLTDDHSGVDIALVQAGLEDGSDQGALVSLGNMFYQPTMIFYRGKPIERLSQLEGKRIAIGPEGSGTRVLALALLKANEIVPGGPTQLLDDEGEAARAALLHGKADAIFLTGDSAAPATIREMLHQEGVRLFDFSRADAYTRRFPYLSKIVIPAGGFDLGADLPATDVTLLAPTVELVANKRLHPALIDLLIDAAQRVHNRATLLQNAGQFPNPVSRSFPVADEAARYYKSGDRSFTYRFLPFWLASLVNRIAVVLVPIVVIVIPGLRFLPQLYRWRIDSRLYRRFAEIMEIEREGTNEELTPERRAALLKRLNQLEHALVTHRIPGSHAEQLLLLRQHISFVRAKLSQSETAPPSLAMAAGS